MNRTITIILLLAILIPSAPFYCYSQDKIIQQPKGDQSPAVIVGPDGTSTINYNNVYNYNYYTAVPAKEPGEVFVTPKSHIVQGGRSEMFIMKITNNKDIPLYDVNLVLEIVSGDLTTDNVKIEPLEESKVTSTLGDRNGSISIAWDQYLMHMASPGKTQPTIIQMIVNNMNPRSTKDYKVSVQAQHLKQKSALSMTITRSSESPNPIIGGVMPREKAQSCTDNDDFDRSFEKGKILLKQSSSTEAKECFERAVRLNPNSVKTRTNLGVAYLSIGEESSALSEWKKAAELDPTAAKPLFNSGVLLMKKGDFSGALQMFEQTVKLNDTELKYDSLVAWGICLKRLNQPDRAYVKYQLAIDLNPGLTHAYFQWGLDLLDQGQYEEATRKFSTVSGMESPLKLDALGFWGAALERAGRYVEAIEKYKKVIAIAPTSPQARKSENSIQQLSEKNKDRQRVNP